MDTETALVLGRLKAEIEAIKADRTAEIEGREILAGYVDGALSRMFGDIQDRAFLVRNGNALNILQKSAGAIVDLVAAAAVNWNGKGSGDADRLLSRMLTPGLIRTLATEALLSGKVAVYPMIRNGEPRLVALSGYVRFILSPDASSGDAPEVVAVVQVIPTRANGQPAYEVRVYSPDLVEIYPPVKDWADYLTNQPARTEEPGFSLGGIPLALAVARMNALRHPSGLIMETLPAFLRYLKTSIDRNAAQEIAGQPEGVIYSDTYLNMLTNPTDARANPLQARAEREAINAARTRGPRQQRFLASADKYEIKPGVDVRPQLEAEQADRRDVQEAFGDLEADGGNLSGVALAERRQRRTTLTESICDVIGGVLTDGLAMLARVAGSGVPADIDVTLTPSFPQDNQAKADQVKGLFESGLMPQSAGLKALQNAGWSEITDEMVRDAETAERARADQAAAMAADFAGSLGDRPATGTPNGQAPAAGQGGADNAAKA